MKNVEQLKAYSKLDGSEIHLFKDTESGSVHILSLCGDTILSKIDGLKPSMLWRRATPEEFSNVKKCMQQ